MSFQSIQIIYKNQAYGHKLNLKSSLKSTFAHRCLKAGDSIRFCFAMVLPESEHFADQMIREFVEIQLDGNTINHDFGTSFQYTMETSE